MREFLVVPEEEQILANGEKFKIGFRKLFEAVLDAPVELSTSEFRRMGQLYNKLENVKDGEILEIEDQDYETLNKRKLTAYIKWMSTNSSATIRNKYIQSFIEAIESMPLKK